MSSPAYRADPRPDLAAVVLWVGGSCTAGVGVGGFVVGWLYGRDQATEASDVPWFGAVGLVVGLVLGLLVSLGPILVLAVVDRLSWAAWRPARALLAAAGAGVPMTLVVQVTSGFSWMPEVVGFCVVISAVPVGLTTFCLDLRTGRAARRDLGPASGSTPAPV